MKKKVVWLVVTGLMVAALLVTSCAPAVVEKEKVAPPKEKEEVVVPEKEVVVPEKEAEMVKLTLTKLDGTIVEKMVEKPRYGGVVSIGFPATVFAFDEAYSPTAPSTIALRLTNNMLLTGDWAKGPAGTGEVAYFNYPVGWEWSSEGDLAESWELLDLETLIFRIRKGVHFALDPRSEASRLVGGREMNAYDVEYSINRLWNTPDSFFARSYPNSTTGISVTATDKWTAVMKFFPGQIGRAAPIYTSDVDIIPREVIEKYGDMIDWKKIVGTGPFKLVDYVDGSSLTFQRNLNYWRKDPLHPENQLPYLDSVKWLIIPDISTQMAALRTGKIDTLRSIRWEDAASLRKTNPELKYTSDFGGSVGILFRVDKPELPSYDIRVRRALYLAINNQEILDEFYGGFGVLNGSPTLPSPEFKNAYVPVEELPESVRELFEYHPDKARQLLAEAGYPNGFKIEVLTTAVDVDLLSIIKEYWAKVGVDLKIDVREVGVHTSITSRKTHTDAIAFGLGGTIPYRMIYYVPGALRNYSVSNDARLVAATDAMSAAWFDYAERDRLMKEITPYLLGQAYEIHLPASEVSVFWQPWVKAYAGEASIGATQWWNFTQYIWLDQELKYEMTGRR